MTVRSFVCWALALFFLAAGFAHFALTDDFAAIVPPPLPFKRQIVQLTGLMELVFAVGLVVPKWRRVTGWALAAYLLAVLPANIHMAIEGLPLGSLDTPAALWGRVALQFPLIALVLWATRAYGFGRRHRSRS
ncbi:DoxX family protein [uncultured Algimonas sp.]|uniref:DoxX family protein n=1 Tax=uncultured Algimonas sp. TaxID=1547920 RepID=UPI002622753D|nr:DoxX family protein [uncultured Algimonas sp.]